MMPKSLVGKRVRLLEDVCGNFGYQIRKGRIMIVHDRLPWATPHYDVVCVNDRSRWAAIPRTAFEVVEEARR